MPFPNYPEKYRYEAVLTAAKRLAYRRQQGHVPAVTPPVAVIFCYQPDVLQYAARKYWGRRVDGFAGELYLLRRTNRRVGVVGKFGVGAPVTAVLLEDLIAWGSRQFFLLGLAGGLQPTQKSGDLIIVTRAIRDEGTSWHYLPPESAVSPPGDLTERMAARLTEVGKPYTLGTTWTTDAPYRETAPEIAHYRERGVFTVEMETAAFFAVAHAHHATAAAGLVIADTLTEHDWQMAPGTRLLQDTLRGCLDTAVEVLAA
ncbi:MAG: phosphorylase [Chloroflexi bacterium]|nr:MAG: phosphorylase [Chloroflexota bacterium]